METWSEKITRWVGSTASIVVHTIFFIGCFVLPFFGVPWDQVLLILTTVVSLEAIYLALFIQMTVNRTTESIEDIEEDIGEITEDIGEVQEDLTEIQEDDTEDEAHDKHVDAVLEHIQRELSRIMAEVENLKRK